ncbi:uncharacterized protein LOC128882956 isoform X2 [Hylaeus volcanicus]|nr:uncharacterized protein LOC128882956 isoform X2 [Hylaeus volcanicus]
MRQAFSLTSPKIRQTFSYHSSPMPTPSIFVWVNTEELDNENQLEKVLKRGLSIQAPYGMAFVHGNISLPNLPLVADPSTNLQNNVKVSQRQLKYLFCELLIGKPLQVDNVSLATFDKLLPEFDSFYIKSPSSSPLHHDTFSNFLANENTDTYSHHVKSQFTYTLSYENTSKVKVCPLGVLPAFSFQNHYVLFHSSQVIVRNIVYINVDPLLPENFALPLCENCQSVQAAVWCKADHACFCNKCDQELHLHSKLASRHTRLPLSKRPRSQGYCFIHPTQTYIYYCLVCEKSLCSLCLPHCPHFNQEEQVPLPESNPIVPLNDTTFFSIDFFSQPKNKSSTILNEAKGELAHLKNMYTNVENNLKGLEHEMHTIISNAFQQLDNLIGYRTISILNRKNSLHIAQNLSYMNDQFISYLNSVLPPPDFLFSWLHYKKLEPEFYKPLTLLDEEIIRDTITWENFYLDGRVEFRVDS